MRERDEKGEAPPQLPAAWFFLGSVHIQATCGGHISHCDPRLQDCFQPKAPSFPCGHTSCAGFAITAFFLTLEILYNFCKKYFKAKKKKKSLILPLPPSGKNPLFIYLSIQNLSTFIEDLLCAGHCQIWRGWQQKKQTFIYREGLWYDVTSSDNTSWSAACACSVARSCLTLCDPTDYGPPGSSVRGISQARILEWVAISSSRGSSRPRDRTRVSCISCIGMWILYC